MSDIVVTVPKNFRRPGAPGLRGLAAWIAEGDCPEDPPGTNFLNAKDVEWLFSTYGPKPRIVAGERVYVVCENRLRGYAPLVRMNFFPRNGVSAPQGTVELIRRGDAVAVTIDERIVGFRGWHYRWWERSIEVGFPEWRTP